MKKKKAAAVPFEPYLLSKLKSPEMAANYLSAILAEGSDTDEDFEVFFRALEKVLQANGISDTAKKLGIARDTLYKIFRSHRNPTVKTLRAILNSVDMDMAVVYKKA